MKALAFLSPANSGSPVPWGSVQVPLRLYWGSIEALLRLYWGSIEAPFRLYWGFIGTYLALFAGVNSAIGTYLPLFTSAISTYLPLLFTSPIGAHLPLFTLLYSQVSSLRLRNVRIVVLYFCPPCAFRPLLKSRLFESLLYWAVSRPIKHINRP